MGVDSKISSLFPLPHVHPTPICRRVACAFYPERRRIAIDLGARFSADSGAARCGHAFAPDVAIRPPHAAPGFAGRRAGRTLAGRGVEPDRQFERGGRQAQSVQADPAAALARPRLRPARHAHPGTATGRAWAAHGADSDQAALMPGCGQGKIASTAGTDRSSVIRTRRWERRENPPGRGWRLQS